MSAFEHDGGIQNWEARSRFTYRDLRNLARSSTSCPLRVIALIDFDAFYAQCETVRLGLPEDKPLCVVQFNHCIALNYAAKAAGLKRIISPEEARLKCPEVVLQHVATWREGDTTWAYRDDVKQHMRTDKAALDPYRKQSRKAFELIKSKLPAPPLQKVEKASVDEVFCDLSAQVHSLLLAKYPCLVVDTDEPDLDRFLPLPPAGVAEWATDILVSATAEQEAAPVDWDDVALSTGAEIVRMIRKEVYAALQYTCSAGVARNKSVAKLAAGHNKPNKQTVVRARAIPAFLAHYKFTKIRGLGGKLGQKVAEAFRTEETSTLLEVSLQDMRSKLGSDSGTWVYNLIRGIDGSEVVERTQLQSMLTAKTFVPKAQDLDQAEKWLRIFAGDIMGRLEEQDATTKHRRPRVITIHHSINGRFGPTRSKQMQIPAGANITAELLFDLFRKLLVQLAQEGPTWPCLVISGGVSDFEDGVSNNRHMTSFFAPKERVNALTDQQRPTSAVLKKRKRDEDDSPQAGAQNQSPFDITTDTEPGEPEAVPFESGKDPKTETDSIGMTELGLYHCPKCNSDIVSAEVLEHLDWHVAIELQDQ